MRGTGKGASRGTEKEGGRRERERRCRIKGNDTCATVCRPDVRCFVTITYIARLFYISAIRCDTWYTNTEEEPSQDVTRGSARVVIGHRDDSKGAEPRVPAFVNASLYAGAGNDVLIDSLPPPPPPPSAGGHRIGHRPESKSAISTRTNCLPIEIDSEMFGLRAQGSLTAISREGREGELKDRWIIRDGKSVVFSHLVLLSRDFETETKLRRL